MFPEMSAMMADPELEGYRKAAREESRAFVNQHYKEFLIEQSESCDDDVLTLFGTIQYAMEIKDWLMDEHNLHDNIDRAVVALRMLADEFEGTKKIANAHATKYEEAQKEGAK